MGIFFRAPASTQALHSAIETALRIQPNTVVDFGLKASEMAVEAQEQTPRPQLSWVRLAGAVAMLALIGGFGMWTATVPSLADWSKMFLHSFEVLFGIVTGLLGGEAASRA